MDFTVDGYVDADEDVATSEAHLLTNSEIITRVTQTQPDATEHDGKKRKMMQIGKCHQIGAIRSVKLLKFFICPVFTEMTENRRCGKK